MCTPHSRIQTPFSHWSAYRVNPVLCKAPASTAANALRFVVALAVTVANANPTPVRAIPGGIATTANRSRKPFSKLNFSHF